MALYEEFEPQPNRLLNAQSAYLRSAAYQPIGWYEYGPEAFAEAKRQNKPIFLDIGAIWCHWCHVIDRESYEDPEIATYLNEDFIPIKVDRDERPDIDARYQLAVQFLIGQGGWPLTVFLTPEGKPFYGGTYFPPENIGEQVGLKTILQRVATAFHQHQDELQEAADILSERVANAEVSAVAPETLSDETYAHVLRGIRARFNVEEGGFEHGAPKFPRPGAIEMALLQWHLTAKEDWRVIAERTLFVMGEGGIYDQLGGGFHRYSTDHSWRVPHFEKLGNDNAVLLQNYVHAYCAYSIESFRDTANGILAFLLRDLADLQQGGFYSSQDADNSMEDDGDYWTWSIEEFTDLLTPEEAQVMVRYYGVQPEGNMPDSYRSVLHVAGLPRYIAEGLEIPLDEVNKRIASGKRKLLQARLHRKMPQIDKSKYTGWNALLISAVLDAGALLDNADATAFALRSVATILRDAYDDDHGFYHNFHSSVGARLPGFLDDQVYMANALLDAFAASGKREYLDVARHVLDLCIAQYWDDEGGGFFDLERTQLEQGVTELLRHPRKSIEDMPMPAPNTMAAQALDRLWALTHDGRYHEFAGKTLEAFAAHAPDYGPFAAYYGLATFYHLHPPATAIIIGHPEDAETQQLWSAALQAYRPGRQLAVYSPDAPNLPYPAAENGTAIAYVCAGQTCAKPTSDSQELTATLLTFGKPKLPEDIALE